MSTVSSSGWTDRGIKLILDAYFRDGAVPTNFYAALATAKGSKLVDAAAAVDKGLGKVGIPVTGHGYAAGAAVCIADSTNYNGTWLVHADSTTDEVVIVATYNAETFAGTETIHEAPGPLTNTLGDLVQIATGNGYADGGLSLNRDTTDFPTLTEDDAASALRSYLRLKSLVYTATSGGPIPASGLGARYLIITDDNATVGSRQVLGYFDLGTAITVSATQSLTLTNTEFSGKWS